MELHLLKRERQRKNLSQKILADFCGLSLSTIVRAEQGKTISADARHRISNYFDMSSEELGLIWVDRLSEAPNSSLVSKECEIDDMNRRQAIQRLGFAGAAVIVGSNRLLSEEPWERLSRALTRSSTIDEATLQSLENITGSYWQLRGDITSRELLSGVLGHMYTVSHLLESTSPTKTQKRLANIAGEVALIAGQMSFDLNDFPTACAYYKAALHAGNEADNFILQSVALARTSFTYIDKHEPTKALVLLNKAEEHSSNSSKLAKAWINAIQAEAYSIMGDLGSAERELDKSADALSRVTDEKDIYRTSFDKSRLSGFQGACYVRLNEPQKAIDALGKTIQNGQTLTARRRARVILDMASAYALKGEVEKACQLAEDALTNISGPQRETTLPRLEKLRSSLAPWRNVAAVRQLEERILLS